MFAAVEVAGMFDHHAHVLLSASVAFKEDHLVAFTHF